MTKLQEMMSNPDLKVFYPRIQPGKHSIRIPECEYVPEANGKKDYVKVSLLVLQDGLEIPSTTALNEVGMELLGTAVRELMTEPTATLSDVLNFIKTNPIPAWLEVGEYRNWHFSDPTLNPKASTPTVAPQNASSAIADKIAKAKQAQSKSKSKSKTKDELPM